MTPLSSSRRAWLGPLALVLLLALWIGWLRAPTLGVTLWNVDEAIHAAVARTLIEGGVIYRDAIDQRTPLSYYAFAAIFKVAGLNNLVAVRIVLVAMIVATAFGLFLLGRRTRGAATGLWAAFIFAALSTHLLYPGDLYALHTEWFVALFTTAAAIVFLWRAPVPCFRRALAGGGLFALAVLSKQPALTDLGAPLGSLALLAALRAAPPVALARAAAGLLLGFGLVTGGVVLSLILAGAGPDFLFYTWTYNLRYYGAEIPLGPRLVSVLPFLAQLVKTYPAAALSGLAAACWLAVRVVQFRGATALDSSRRWESYLLLWCGSSFFGAMSSGRGFDHYFIQFLPAFAWLAAWLPGLLCERWRGYRAARPALVVAVAGAMLLYAANLLWTPLAGRHPALPPPDPALRLAAFIDAHSTPDQKIFVWGYNPDIYLYANRAPASRFVYCSFQTGLIPWTNEAPEIDTRYAIVPGSMDTLLDDLSRHRPAFIVDCGVGPHRRFSKYPLARFAPLSEFVAAHYIEVDPERYRAQGFRLFIRRDTPAGALDPTAETGASAHPLPSVHGPGAVGLGSTAFDLSVDAPQGGLTRLAVYRDGVEQAATRFPATNDMKLRVEVMFDQPSAQPHQLVAVADWADGTRTASAPTAVSVMPLGASAEQRIEFALPLVTGSLPSFGVRALFNPNASWSEGRREFNLHAPSLLRYVLPAKVTAIRGHFGLPANAYAPENKAPTDGAEFILRVIGPDQNPQVLWQRLLRPAADPADRAVQSFRTELNHLPAGTLLELEISPGPFGNPSSDWTFWSDIVLETSP